jgi:hypothetical protein
MKIADKTLELHITYRCNFACANCITLVGVAPEPHDMTIAEVQSFLQDSADADYRWTTISLYGGEPTLHPDFEEICRMLFNYKVLYDKHLRLQVISNGTDMDKIKIAEDYDFGPMISIKTGNNRDHAGNAMPYSRCMESPIDIGRESTIGCWMSGECGIAYNRIGYFPCSPSASAARVFGFNPAARSAKNLTYDTLRECHTRVCAHCGMGQTDHVVRRTIVPIITQTWKTALDKYNGQ